MAFDSVMVTGGAGFIGSHTVEALLGLVQKVWVLDDLSTGSLLNLRTHRGDRRLRVKHGTVTNYKTVESIAGRVDGIIHLAAIVSPYMSLRSPEITNEVNVTGTLNVLRASMKKHVERVVFASSSSVYGNASAMPVSEDQVLNPITPYGVSKLAAERYCVVLSKTNYANCVSLRYFNVYGQRQSDNPYSGVIAIFASQIAKGRQPKIYGDGEQRRDFVHVSDVVKANLCALEVKGDGGEVFNVGTGKATSVNQLFDLMTKLLNKNGMRPNHVQERIGDIKDSYADVAKSKTFLGFGAEVDLERGLRLLFN